MILPLYRILSTLLGPALYLYLLRRKRLGKEDPARFHERFGHAGRPRPEGQLIWIHAASVGESQSMLPLIEHLLNTLPGASVLFTTGTVSSAEMIKDRLPARAIHQYVPVDRLSAARRFLDHWRPDLALWAESEFWPNLIQETQHRDIPMVLVNGRISPKSFAGWKRAPGVIGTLLKGFALCLGQTEGDAERLRELGAVSHKCVGNLKFASPPLAADEAQLNALSLAIGERPCWVAASTHAGEEEIAAAVHRQLLDEFPNLLTIIVPRHAHRGESIAASLTNGRVNIALRSNGTDITPETGIYIADTMGELGLFFRLAQVVFMGKSLLPLGGQNPLEPLRLNRPVLHGPHMANFQEMVDHLGQANATITVADETELGQRLRLLLTNEGERTALAQRGKAYAESQDDVVETVTSEILNLPRVKAAAGAADHAT